MSELLNELIRTGIGFGNSLLLVSYFLLILIVLKIVETGIGIVHTIRGRREKIVREIETVERRRKEVKPVLKDGADGLIEELLKDGRVRLVCPDHGCEVRLLVDGSVYCPECEGADKNAKNDKNADRNVDG